MKLQKYKKEFEFSYTLGPFPTFELLNFATPLALEVHASPEFNELEKLKALCDKKGVPFILGDSQIKKISGKEICYAAGVFKKQAGSLDSDAHHVVLHNISDMGNLGTILRTLLGFGIENLAIIQPAADIYSPKVVRASMGAIFQMKVQLFESFDEYVKAYGDKRDLFPFMLTGKNTLNLENCPKSSKYSLIFGNEARGLPTEFEEIGTAIFIPQSSKVDSLNLAVSVGVGVFVFKTANNR